MDSPLPDDGRRNSSSVLLPVAIMCKHAGCNKRWELLASSQLFLMCRRSSSSAALHAGFTNLRAAKIATSHFGDSDVNANLGQAGQDTWAGRRDWLRLLLRLAGISTVDAIQKSPPVLQASSSL